VASDAVADCRDVETTAETLDPMASPSPAPGWRRALVVAIGALLALVVAQGAYRTWRIGANGWGPARFLWAEDARGGAARAFYLARDFLLEDDAALSGARLQVLGDEEYQVHLNGVWVGSGRYRTGGRAGNHDVSGLLRPGSNRLVVEARSATGVGGVLAALFVAGAERPVVATDAAWRVFGHHVEGLVEGTYRIDDGESPRVLGRPPWGRWRSPPAGTLRPAAPLESQDVWAAHLAPLPPRPERLAREAWRIDFGAEVEGYLELWTDLGSCACALRFFATEDQVQSFYAARSGIGRLTGMRRPSRALVAVPGSPRWRDVEPRRYRYVTFEAPHPPAAARVLLAEADAQAPRAPSGPFGLPPPPG
jgi:hypothetical protein